MKSKQRIQKTLTAFAVLLLLSGCGTALKGPKMSEIYTQLPELNQVTARVHFIRPGEKALGGNARIHLDEKRIVELPLSGCHYEDVSVGKHDLMLDLWGGMGSHELEVDFEPGSNRYFKIWPRKSRGYSVLALGVIGAAIENLVSEKNNDGEMEMIELAEKDALPLLEQCVLYKEEKQ